MTALVRYAFGPLAGVAATALAVATVAHVAGITTVLLAAGLALGVVVLVFVCVAAADVLRIIGGRPR
jgi:hypothetical protein